LRMVERLPMRSAQSLSARLRLCEAWMLPRVLPEGVGHNG
jgi:hypothetical protein